MCTRSAVQKTVLQQLPVPGCAGGADLLHYAAAAVPGGPTRRLLSPRDSALGLPAQRPGKDILFLVTYMTELCATSVPVCGQFLNWTGRICMLV